jgi:hypothetical protein
MIGLPPQPLFGFPRIDMDWGGFNTIEVKILPNPLQTTLIHLKSGLTKQGLKLFQTLHPNL